MEITTIESQELMNQHYNFAANLLLNQRKSGYETKNALIEQGLSTELASTLVEKLELQIQEAEYEATQGQAKKDMLYGALWCVGGTILTLSHIGFIFWGAIVFGGIQFFKGVIKYSS
ncbi:hypothetical protein EV144_10988 [Flavobacterium sp. 270]|uniref:hypothetical protein n=1 Tax=Flavobacterium sp. 270 TaxID=2512114 RepID=UPI001065F323|nr:hypothetical protein [Flavobacterium sp. 270]TDW44335.1 hypothetical protein EV144_10988 [Flavobacterium sp. 270]